MGMDGMVGKTEQDGNSARSPIEALISQPRTAPRRLSAVLQPHLDASNTPCVMNFAYAVNTRFKKAGDRAGLDDCITKHGESLD